MPSDVSTALAQEEVELTLDFGVYLTEQLRAKTVSGVRVSEGGEITFTTRDKLSALVVGFTKLNLQALAVSVFGVDGLDLADDAPTTPSGLSGHALSASSAPPSTPTTLADLTVDVLDVVAAFIGSPTAVSRLICSCPTLTVAATQRHPEWAWLQNAVQTMMSWNQACHAAAMSGRLEALRWAIAQGCKVTDTTVCSAARGGQLAVLQWLRAQTPACPLSELTSG